jgi:hypothetical protein
MRRWWVLALVLGTSGLAQAEANRAFARLRDKAQAVDSLATFLSSFVGDCGADLLGGSDCQKKVKAFRSEALGKTYYVILDDAAQKLVQPRGFSPQTHQMEFALTPFFESAGLALTHGQPDGLDAQGQPIIRLIRMQATLPDEITPMEVDRVFRTGMARMQVIFKPLSVWKVPRKDRKGFVEGVKAQVLGVRISEARSGSDVVTWTSDK